MLIDKSNFDNNCLAGKTVLVTGGGGGIGFEAARALVRLGANVIIAEINKEKGRLAQEKIRKELSTDRIDYYYIDITNNDEIQDLYKYIKESYGFLDAIINNATIAPIGSIEDVSLDAWDKSYNVNLKAPVNLAKTFLPDMKKEDKGTIVFVSSSGAAPYMGAYEIFKSSQVELCNTLYGELQGFNINTFVIGPGLVKTETAVKSIEKVAKCMGVKPLEIYNLNEKHMLDIESAGTGFAASIVLASKYNGQEIGSIQVLMDANIFLNKNTEINSLASQKGIILFREMIPIIVDTYCEQYEGWQKRNIFEKQWVLRDFRKYVGHSANQFKDVMIEVKELVRNHEFEKISTYKGSFIKLKEYYLHQHKLLQGYEKNPQKLKESSKVLTDWIKDLQTVIDSL